MANTHKKIQNSNTGMPESAALEIALGKSSVEAKLESIAQLPEPTRARMAEFCYRRVHLRELGLRVAATCSYRELLRTFGTGARAVQHQAVRVEDTLKKITTSPLQQPSRLLIDFS